MPTGSRDTTVIVWEIHCTVRPAKGRGKPQPVLPLNHVPLHVLSGHTDAVICLAASCDLDLVVSASANGEILIHLLSSGRCVPPGVPVWNSAEH